MVITHSLSLINNGRSGSLRMFHRQGQSHGGVFHSQSPSSSTRTAAASAAASAAAAVSLEPPPTTATASTAAAADARERRAKGTRRQRKRKTDSDTEDSAITVQELLKRLSGNQADSSAASDATLLLKLDPSATGLSLVAEVAAFLVRLDAAESSSSSSSPSSSSSTTSSQAPKGPENDNDGDVAPLLEVTREVREQLEAAWNLSPSDSERGIGGGRGGRRKVVVRGRRFLSPSATKRPANEGIDGGLDVSGSGSEAELDPAARRRAMRRRLRAAAVAMGLRMSGNALELAEDEGHAERLAEGQAEAEAGSDSPRRRGIKKAGAVEASAMSEAEVDALIRDYGGGDTAMNVDWTKERSLLPAREEIRLAELIQRGNKLEEERARIAAAAAESAAPAAAAPTPELTVVDSDSEGSLQGYTSPGAVLLQHPQKQHQNQKQQQLLLSHSEWAAHCKLTPGQLHRQLLAAQAARNKLILHNLRLVLSIAHSFRLSTGADFIAVCQRGLEGLTTAAQRFDPSRGFRFSTFATHAVRTAIIRAIPATQFVRMPARSSMTLISVRKARAAVEQRLGRRATVAEVAAEAGLPAAQCRAALAAPLVTRPVSLHSASRLTGLPLEDTIASMDESEGGIVASRPATAGAAVRATAAAGGGGGSGDGCAGAGAGDGGAASSISAQGGALDHTRASLVAVLDTLHPHEATVLRWRFGLGGKDGEGVGEALTLRQIAAKMGLSYEMVRRYEARGLLKLQVPARAQALQENLRGGL
ncbi:hypothetical protein CLOM_g16817 [Closterium sp. NIES-68]|nr:hypothetical protein CLOM_g16817 [Closterium sp. NIES-68]GJP75613.1 hypothetical protein CLOP_g6042 [Closterium sp. NIES-67]